MPKYNVDKTFWRNGLEVTAGESITLSKAEAKYLGHVVSESKVEAAPAPAPAVEPDNPAPVAGVTVAEKPQVRRKRDAEPAHDHIAN
jgi:hypothetical protein